MAFAARDAGFVFKNFEPGTWNFELELTKDREHMAEHIRFLSGNEAIAHGAFKAGCQVAAAYPGTPSTEILQHVAKFKEQIYCEWSVNEKVAMEVVIGASFAGARALTAMKHVGLNVAADPLMTFSYIGANGELVIVTADNPGMHSSQNEQDNRFFARFAKVPLFEPSDSQEAYEMTVAAFEVSEQYGSPVILRMTTRTSHSSALVDLGDFTPRASGARGYEKDVAKNIPVPVFARQMRVKLEERLARLRDYAESCPFNRIEAGDGDIGIVTSGIAYQYVKEVFPEASVLKLGFTHPLPKELIRQFAAGVQRLYVVEELEPFLEEQIRALGIPVQNHASLQLGELNPDRLAQLRAEILGEAPPSPRTVPESEGLPRAAPRALRRVQPSRRLLCAQPAERHCHRRYRLLQPGHVQTALRHGYRGVHGGEHRQCLRLREGRLPESHRRHTRRLHLFPFRPHRPAQRGI